MTALSGDEALLVQVLSHIPDPRLGLPDPVFDFALKIVPMINVDLLVRRSDGAILLAWRDDDWGRGWHVPGGIIRFNEPISDRISKTAIGELGVDATILAGPVATTEFFGGRGHFISLLFKCQLVGEPVGLIDSEMSAKPGELHWFASQPAETYPVHSQYVADLIHRPTSA